MKHTKTDFGTLDGNKVSLFTLKNANGMEVKISDYGATVTSIKVPNKEGKIEEISCGFDNFDNYFSPAYQANAPYFGGTVGRYCSQIKDAKFSLNGVEYQLAQNAGNNNLHGGKIGFDKKLWQADYIEADGQVRLEMKLISQDMEEGFPGNVDVKVSFALTDENELRMDYQATSDQDTPFAITNHIYFNLSGFRTSVENHFVTINATKLLQLDDSGAATGEIISVEDAPEDLRKQKVIQQVQEALGGGFEHFYVFEEKGFKLEKVAAIHNAESGRTLEVSTSEPAMLFYTGKYTSNELKRESGEQYGKYRGFCCETHRYPNGPNIESPKSILKAGELFESTTIFRFSW